MQRIGIIGLGIMGSAYARNLISADFPVTGYDVDADRMQVLAGLGGNAADTPSAVADAADVILVALPKVGALEEVTSGADGIVEGASGDELVVEMSTFPLDAKLAMREALVETGVESIDAPVSGTGLQADQAEIVVYASGESAVIERARPVFEAISKETYNVGEFGNGSKMKFLANLLVSVHNLVTAETFVLGQAAGLDPERILEVISAGVGSSRIFEIRGPMVVADDYPPAARLEMFIKDIGVIGDFARSVGSPTPLLDACLPWYEEAVEKGLGDLDAAALARLLESKLPESS